MCDLFGKCAVNSILLLILLIIKYSQTMHTWQLDVYNCKVLQIIIIIMTKNNKNILILDIPLCTR